MAEGNLTAVDKRRPPRSRAAASEPLCGVVTNQMMLLALAAACCIALTCACADDVPAASAPEWVRALFSPTDARTALRLLQAEEIEGGVEAICEYQYPNIAGNPAKGKAKLFLPTTLATDNDARVPLMHFAGYELDRPGAASFLARGIAASTPCGEEFNPLVRGENVDISILHRVRALPFIDDARVEVFGGSAGGYMSLMVAAETFPLNCCAPDVPPVNLGYNVGYLARNRGIAHAQPEGQEHPNMPVVTVVTLLADQGREIYGSDFDGDAYLAASPISRLDCITCPTLITAVTADLLVPINQIGVDLAKPLERSLFPDGFAIEMGDIISRDASQRTLVEALGEGRLDVFTVPVPDDAPRMKWDGTAEEGQAPVLKTPFSEGKQFSLVVFDEGAPEPQCGHMKHAFGIDKGHFLDRYRDARPGTDQLTLPKLTRLMQRYLHLEGFPALVRPPGSPAPFIANRLDFPEAERADVLRGLRTFAADPDCLAKLRALYAELPPELKALGDGLDLGDAER